MTPRELTLYVDEHNARIEREYEREQRNLLTQAYLTAAWQRANRMPKLEKVLSELKPKQDTTNQPQTDEQMFAAALAWQKRLKEGR